MRSAVFDANGPWPQQIRLENIVKPVFVRDLETFPQAGGPHQVKLGSLRQEDNSSFRFQVELNRREGLSDPVHL